MQEMLKEYLMKGNVEKIQIVNQAQARVFLRKESNLQQQMVTINLGRAEAFEQKLEPPGGPFLKSAVSQGTSRTSWALRPWNRSPCSTSMSYRAARVTGVVRGLYGGSREVTGLGLALERGIRLESDRTLRTDYLGEILPYVPSLLFLIPLLMVSRS